MIMHLIKRSDVVSNSHVFEKWWRLIPRISITHDRYEIRRKCTQLSVDNKEIQFYFSSVTNFNFLHIHHDTDLLMNYDENWKIEILSNTTWEDEYLWHHRYCDNVSSEHVTDFFSIQKNFTIISLSTNDTWGQWLINIIQSMIVNIVFLYVVWLSSIVSYTQRLRFLLTMKSDQHYRIELR